MEMFLSKILPALLGFLGGVVGSIFAPWSKWGVEKRRERLKYRQTQINRWREFMTTEFEQLSFSETTVYSELRPYLSKETRRSIEGNEIIIRDGRGGNVVKSLVLDDIAELEKKWKLL
jgi:hypothetical protein